MKEGEYTPQPSNQPDPEKGERQPLPSVVEILERRAQLRETRMWDRFRHEHKHSREYLALYRENRQHVLELGDEAASLYAEWPERDRLIFDLYTTSVDWRLGLSAEKTQQFIARVSPFSEEELAEELRSAREASERKAARYKQMADTQRRNRGFSHLPPQMIEATWNNDALPRSYRERTEQRRLQAEQQQPTQVFPPPTQE